MMPKTVHAPGVEESMFIVGDSTSWAVASQTDDGVQLFDQSAARPVAP